MTKLFYDNLLNLEELETIIKKSSKTQEEREELWGLVDEILNHKVLEKILDKLPEENHIEFLELYHKCPHDEIAVFAYLKGKSGENIIDEIKEDLKKISEEILAELGSLDGQNG